MSKKKKGVLGTALPRVHWKTIIILLLLALWFSSPFLTMPEFDKAELKMVKSTISNIEEHHARMSRSINAWVTFKTADGERFCYSIIGRNELIKTSGEAADILESYSGKPLTVYYTEKRPLNLMSLFLIDYTRVVAVECGREIVFDIDEFNNSTRSTRITWGIISGVLLAVAVIIFLYPIIRESALRRKRLEKKQRKQAKKETLRRLSAVSGTDDDCASR